MGHEDCQRSAQLADLEDQAAYVETFFKNLRQQRDLENEMLEVAYWEFDARRAGRYKRDPHGVLGPQEERMAFKDAVRFFLTMIEPKRGAGTPLAETPFATCVAGYLGTDALAPSRLRKLADALEAMPATVQRWADGSVVPRTGTQSLVMEWIKLHA